MHSPLPLYPSPGACAHGIRKADTLRLETRTDLIDGDTCPNAVMQLVASYHNSDGTRSEIRLGGDVAESALSHTSCILGVIMR